MPNASDLIAIIVAAGRGTRFGNARPKQYLTLDDRTVLEHSIEALREGTGCDEVIVAVREDDTCIDEISLKGALVLRTGGETREATVYKTLLALADRTHPDTLVLVHDAARPLVAPVDIRRLIQTAQTLSSPLDGAVLTMSLSDTVKRVNREGELIEDIDRAGLVRVATPQAFRYQTLVKALSTHQDATDESTAVRAIGGRVKAVVGDAKNFKITQAEDLTTAQRLLQGAQGMSAMRVGLGYDSHRLVQGRKLILAGLQIENGGVGLDGHSDADVLVHALIDALLGAAALGNIGQLFPDNDPRYKGADSMRLLGEVVRLLGLKGFQIVNVDLVLIAQAPKMNPHLPQMIANLAQTLGIEATQISIKPKTNERMGFEGREEGMSAQAVVLIEKQ